ncbi:hypothetical protein [Sulfobacillus harzensis]|uniref:Uncharacterized protein n=1 Tax=Sulfobacillus harzensis TaxID=2729629 RepID=A0A7Y0L659_9FIRM|nr:hypothetical protein [Sulfobacillus harzensis]NMP24038.1 hypothetical protein [Sulfobacillus harzensis]
MERIDRIGFREQGISVQEIQGHWIEIRLVWGGEITMSQGVARTIWAMLGELLAAMDAREKQEAQ